jgi:hypothetical protein
MSAVKMLNACENKRLAKSNFANMGKEKQLGTPSAHQFHRKRRIALR